MESCRLCYSEISLHLYRTVFNTGDEPPILDIVRKLTDINISESDAFSKVMCLNCYDKLTNIHDFVQIMLQTNSKFDQKSNDNYDIHQNFAQLLEIKQENCENDQAPTEINDNGVNNAVETADVETKINICEKIEECQLALIKDEIHKDENVNTTDSAYGNEENSNNTDTNEHSMLSNNDEIIPESKTTDRGSSTFKTKRFNCNTCGKIFKYISSLQKHLKIHEKQYKCNICSKIFPYQSDLNEHKKIHNNINSYKCDICKKEFTLNKYLSKHLKTHLDEEPSKCDICDREFLRKDTLRKHKKVHSDDRIYTCDICDQVFTQFLEFRDHKQLHSDKLYECNICGKKFLHHGNSMKHLKTHFGEKTHECDVCGDKFTQKSSLIRHFRVHTRSGDIEIDQKATQLQLPNCEK